MLPFQVSRQLFILSDTPFESHERTGQSIRNVRIFFNSERIRYLFGILRHRWYSWKLFHFCIFVTMTRNQVLRSVKCPFSKWTESNCHRVSPLHDILRESSVSDLWSQSASTLQRSKITFRLRGQDRVGGGVGGRTGRSIQGTVGYGADRLIDQWMSFFRIIWTSCFRSFVSHGERQREIWRSCGCQLGSQWRTNSSVYSRNRLRWLIIVFHCGCREEKKIIIKFWTLNCECEKYTAAVR